MQQEYILININGAREHKLDVTRNADWIIDMGPEAGHRGGE